MIWSWANVIWDSFSVWAVGRANVSIRENRCIDSTKSSSHPSGQNLPSLFWSLDHWSIHPKRWCPRCQDSADNFEFSAERLSENAKSIKITLFAELLTVIFLIYMSSPWKLSIKTLKHYILNKNATLTPNSCDFYDLRTFVGKFCRCDLRTFSAEFWRLKRRNPQTESLFECMHWSLQRCRKADATNKVKVK